MLPRLAPALLAVIASTLAACSLPRAVGPYRIDVRQGNYVTPEMVAQLKTGMRPDQVRFVLGTPLIVDPFHKDRWDYVYRFAPGKGELTQRRLSVHFRDGVLAEVSGDVTDAKVASGEPATRVIEIPRPSADE